MLWLLLVFATGASCSVGDRLPEFHKCLQLCGHIYGCESRPGSVLQNVLDSVGSSSDAYLAQAFEQYSINPICRGLFLWDCALDCNYKCQRIVTEHQVSSGGQVVQFYGKWPFVRVFGMQEVASVAFSVANLMASYRNWPLLHKQYKKHGPNSDAATMYCQYMALVAVSVVGWTFSTLFHCRDNGATEVLDYFGAAGIVLANFNAIFVRYFGLFRAHNASKRRLFHTGLAAVFVLHCWKLHRKWDYQYNMTFGVCFGLAALALWMLHSFAVARAVALHPHVYNNSIQLLPFETKILSKLEHVGLALSKYIPTLPVLLNLWMVAGMSFELMDFAPVWGLLDAHAIWHLFTIFPSLIWYDWNIWDVELDMQRGKMGE